MGKKRLGHRIAAFLLCIVLSVSAMSVYTLATEGVYLDTTIHWCKEPIRFWTERGVVKGVGANLFRPDDAITRQMAAVVVCRFLGLEQEPVTEAPFPDVPEDSPYVSAIAACSKAGLIIGDEHGLYRPEDSITRNAAMVLLARTYHLQPCSDLSALSVFEDADTAAWWAEGHIAALVEIGIVQGWSGRLRGTNPCTRAEFVQMLRLFVGEYYDGSGIYDLERVQGDGSIALAAGGITLTGSTEQSLLLLPGTSDGTIDINGSTIGGGVDVWGKDTELLNAAPGTVIRTGTDAGTTLVNGVQVPSDTVYIVPQPSGEGGRGGSGGSGGGGYTPPTPTDELSLSWWAPTEHKTFGADGEKFLPGDRYSRTYELEVKATKDAKVVFTQIPRSSTDTELAEQLQCELTVTCGSTTASTTGSLAELTSYTVDIPGAPDVQKLTFEITVELPTSATKELSGKSFSTDFQWKLEAQ